MCNSPIFDPNEDFETQRLGRVLNDRTMSYEERARIILGENERIDIGNPTWMKKFFGLNLLHRDTPFSE